MVTVRRIGEQTESPLDNLSRVRDHSLGDPVERRGSPAGAERVKSDCGRLIVRTEPKDVVRSAEHIECGAGDVRADGVARKDYASPAVAGDDKLRVYSIITLDNQNISWFRRASPFFII
jgi:hypothetical protein